MDETPDHDLLIRIDERIKRLELYMTNHLHHHWQMTLAAWGVASVAIATAVIAVLKA